jgi:HK97 family phage prohead protease
MNQEKKYRTFGFEVKAAQDNGKVGYIEGYASTFGNMDLGMDVVEPGAFSKTIRDKNGKFIILLDHNPRTPIGWNIEASEDATGLSVKGEINLITEEAINRYQLAKRACELGTKMGLSIGYSTIKSEPDFNNPMITHLRELKLWEYSLVVFPMNEEAGVENAKAQKIKILFDELKNCNYPNSIIKALADLGIASPEKPAAAQQHEPDLLHSVDKLIEMFRV